MGRVLCTVALVAAIGAVPEPAFAWGFAAHRLIMRRAIDLLPPELRPLFERHRDEYFQRLFDISAGAAWTEWMEFCLRGVAAQARDTIERCHKLRRIRESYLAKLPDTRGSVRLHKIVEGLFHSPFVRVADAQRTFAPDPCSRIAAAPPAS